MKKILFAILLISSWVSPSWAATYYSQGSGLWSTLANWDTNSGGGGSDPASVAAMEDNLFIIQAGHVIDYDLTATSSWTTGFQTITITGHATTPGVLRCDSTTLAAGTYILPMKTGYSIVGTTGAEKGRILSNSDGVWANTGSLANDRKFIISTLTGSSTVATIDATYLTARLYCTQPTNTYVEIYGTPYIVTCEADDDKVTFVSPSTTPPQAGTPVTLSGTLPAELVVGTTYFIRDVSGSTCKLEATIGGGAINLTDDGSGTIYLHYGAWGPVVQSTSVNTTTGVITWNGVPPAADTAVRVKSSGTLPTGLTAYDLYYVRTISGNTCKLSLISGSDTGIVIPSGVGSGNISMYVGSTYTTSKVVNVIQDVTTEWVTTAGGNGDNVVLTDYGPADYDQQRDVIATFNSRYLILTTNNIDSVQYPLARIYLVSRNVGIRSASTGAQPIVTTSTGGVFQCGIRNTAGTGTTFYGYALSSSSNNTISGVISGCTAAIFNNSNNNTISGVISGCSYALNGSNNNTISGVISGCSYAIYSNSNNNTISGVISGCNYAIYTSNNNTISGVISGCNYLAMSGGLLTAMLVSVNTPVTPVFYDRNTTNFTMRIASENHGRVEGSMIIFDMFGDIIKTACNGTGDAPSVDPVGGNGYSIGAINLLSNLGIPTGAIYPNVLLIFDKHRLWLTAAEHTVTYKVQTTYAGITAGNLKLTARYITTGGALAEITNAPTINQRATAADWTQTLAVTFTQVREGWVDFKMELMEYESGNEVFVWPIPAVTNMTGVINSDWSLGDSILKQTTSTGGKWAY